MPVLLGPNDDLLPPLTCASCGSTHVSSDTQEIKFAYGVEPDTIMLSCHAPVFSCSACGDRWLGYEAEEAQDAAIRAHLANKATP